MESEIKSIEDLSKKMQDIFNLFKYYLDCLILQLKECNTITKDFTDKIFEKELCNFDTSVRLQNVFLYNNLEKMIDIFIYDDKSFLRLKHAGKKSLNELKDLLTRNGIIHLSKFSF